MKKVVVQLPNKLVQKLDRYVALLDRPRDWIIKHALINDL